MLSHVHEKNNCEYGEVYYGGYTTRQESLESGSQHGTADY